MASLVVIGFEVMEKVKTDDRQQMIRKANLSYSSGELK